jgi:bifunctional non-homologous end joining protein LigD
MGAGSLDTYQRMRDFRSTPEPRGRREAGRGAGSFVIQKHAARRLHYDFRLEWNGVFRSWAIPKGPSLDSGEKRMAVEVEDHPLSYGSFEGVIPAGQYGAGSVQIWDRGKWKPVGDAGRGLREGKLKFTLEGSKLHGGFTLVRMRSRGEEKKAAWLLIKEKDAAARTAADFAVVEQRGDSVVKRRRGRSALPLLLAPQLATLVDAPPAGDGWRYELKLDGYRLLTRVDRKGVRCFTRSGQDWSTKLPQVVAAVRDLDLAPCWLDGEILVLDEHGVPDFQRLQNAFERDRTAEIRYFAFDLPFHDGHDLRDTALDRRRELLRHLLASKGQERVKFSATLAGHPQQLLEAARAAGFEGLIGKRADAPYHSGRNRDWIKLKTGLRQEFVIGGFTDPQGSRAGLGSLLLGVYDTAGSLRYAGNVGTGFDQKVLGTLRAKLEAIEIGKSPFADAPEKVGTVKRVVPHWTRPKLVAEVAFAGWTASGSVRHAVFHGLRDDKPPRQIVREAARAVAEEVPGPKITHPDRVIDTTSGITKGELVAYYAAVASLLRPHLDDRPVSLLRAPDGVAGGKFFQKHAEARAMPHLLSLPPSLDPGHAPLLVIPTKLALLSAAQMNVVELHTWNAVASRINKPDRMVFDLDPGEGVEWSAVRESAQLLHALLDELKLRSFLKTSGGKGLHVVVPLQPELGWDQVKAFSKRVVEHLAKTIPQRFVAKSGPRNRIGRVFVDYLRNGRGATTACAWSARARAGMGISVPLDWDELPEVQQMSWTVANCATRLPVGNKPWRQYERARQSLKSALRELE